MRGMRPVTKALQVSIEDEPVKVVTVMPSAGWLVGGAIKLAMEKDSDVPEGKIEVTTLLNVTTANEVEPVHWIAEFTFCIAIKVPKIGYRIP